MSGFVPDHRGQWRFEDRSIWRRTNGWFDDPMSMALARSNWRSRWSRVGGFGPDPFDGPLGPGGLVRSFGGPLGPGGLVQTFWQRFVGLQDGRCCMQEQAYFLMIQHYTMIIFLW